MRRSRLAASAAALSLTAFICGALAPPALRFSARPAASGEILERVVLVARHGIRSPTRSPEMLQQETGVQWPVWPVAPGQLTAHGRETLHAMMRDIADYYDLSCHEAGKTCLSRPSPLVWADSADDRTRESGQIMVRAFAPLGKARSLPAGEHDPLFDGVPEGYVSAHKRVLYDDAASAGAFDASHRPDTVQSGLRALQALIVPQGCDIEKGPCFIRPLKIGEKKGRPVIDGGPAGAASLAENLLLIHVEGLDRDATRWVGRIDEKILSAVLPVHGYMAQLTRRRGALVEQKAHQLVGVLEDFLDGNEVTLPDETTVGRDIRFLAFAGHDTTLDALAAHYGLDWHFDDQPDETAPDTTLAFERWRSPEGRITVRVRLFHQSLAALRQGKGLDLDHGGQILLEPRHQ